jgi:hypothetical protein
MRPQVKDEATFPSLIARNLTEILAREKRLIKVVNMYVTYIIRG